MDPRKRTARIAGIFYLAVALSGPLGILYVPSVLIVAGDPQATAANIAAHPLLVRIGILSTVVCQVSFVCLARALARLFEGVADVHVKLMVSLVTAAVPIAVVNELFHVAALEVATSDPHGGLALTFMNVRQTGIAIVGFFWGLWLLPFGMLAIKSRFIPKILGVLLIAGCFSYLTDSSVALLAPGDRDALSTILMVPLALGEISTVIWLLARGVRPRGGEQERPGATGSRAG
jgi:Domain of unknown function (DUF4386)